MANHPQAIKRHRQSIKRRRRNKFFLSTMRSSIKAVRTAVEILNRREEPQLISLPVSIRIEGASGNHELEQEASVTE